MASSRSHEADAELSAHVFVTTDTWGTFTHGTRQIRGLMQNARRGRLVATAKEKIVAEGPSWAIIDACDGMPPAISYRAVELAVDKARKSGMCYIGIRGSSHYGAAGFYANMIAENDMIGLSMCNVEPCMTVPGGKSKVLGTNPIAYAAPTGTDRTVMLDIATSAVAATKIFAPKTKGATFPTLGWWTKTAFQRPIPPSFRKKGHSCPWPDTKGTDWPC